MLSNFLDWLTELIFPPQWATPDGTPALGEAEPLFPQWMAFGTTGSRGVKIKSAGGKTQIMGGVIGGAGAGALDKDREAAAKGDMQARQRVIDQLGRAQKGRLENQRVAKQINPKLYKQRAEQRAEDRALAAENRKLETVATGRQRIAEQRQRKLERGSVRPTVQQEQRQREKTEARRRGAYVQTSKTMTESGRVKTETNIRTREGRAIRASQSGQTGAVSRGTTRREASRARREQQRQSRRAA